MLAALVAVALLGVVAAAFVLRDDPAAPAATSTAAMSTEQSTELSTEQTTEQSATSPPDAAVQAALLTEARALLAAGSPDDALTVLETVLAGAPDDPEALALFDDVSRALAAASQARAEEALLADARAESADGEDFTASDPAERESERERAPVRARNAAQAATPRRDETAAPEPTRTTAELWTDARRARDDERYHTLRDLLDEILASTPGDRRARDWRDDVGDWIEDREDDLRDEVDDLLDELADAIDDRDRRDLAQLWGPRRDRAPTAFFDDLWSRYPATDAKYHIESVTARDDSADFVATVTLRGKERKGLRQRYNVVREVRWRGRLVDDRDGPHFVSAFP